MSLTALTLIINGVTVALSLVMLTLILLQDSRTSSNLFFTFFIAMVVLWSSGTILSRVSAYVGAPEVLTDLGVRLLEVGFTGSCVGLYLFVTVLSGGQTRRFVYFAVSGAAVLMAYQSITVFAPAPPPYIVLPDAGLSYSFSDFGILLYGSFIAATLIVAWGRRRKMGGRWMQTGVFLFNVGMLLELLSPQLRTRAVGMNLSAISSLMVSYALIRAQIIDPLAGRATQLQAVRDVGVAITSRVNLQEVLSTVAGQAGGILQADGAAIFLSRSGALELAAVHNMPDQFLSQRLAIGQGVAGKAAATRQTYRLENYRRDWTGEADMPFAKESFGSVLAAPLIFADEVVGVLFVAAGINGKRFDREDAQLLELVSPQAAVAITNSRLFQRQSLLTSELEAAKNQLETLLTSAQNPVLALNRRLEIIFANPAAVELLDSESFAGKPIFKLKTMQHVLPSAPMRVARELFRKRVYTYEVTVRERTYLCHIGLLGRAHPQGYVAVLNDISELKELDALKNQMIRMTSHDLKNPLTAAMLHVEELQELSDPYSVEMKEQIDVIWQQLQRMNRIIHGILDLERLQSGTTAREECDLTEIIQGVVREIEPQAARTGVTLKVNLPADLPTIPGDRHYLIRAVANLVENAIKFTPSGGVVSIGGEKDSSFAIIHIADTGIGIPRDSQTRIFERFYRANQPGAEQITGTGLGLSLVKSVVDAHKGRIWLESEAGKGTTFHFALPLKQ